MYSIRTELFICPYCGVSRDTKIEVEVHMEHCVNNPALHACASCAYVGLILRAEGSAAADIECLCRHEVNKQNKLHETNGCEHYYSKNRADSKPIRKTTFQYICPYCGTRRHVMRDMMEHIESCAHNPDAVKKRTTCKYCELTGSARDILQHAKVCSGNPDNKRCKTCKHFELDSSREVACLGPTGTQDMRGMYKPCSVWQSKTTEEAEQNG